MVLSRSTLFWFRFYPCHPYWLLWFHLSQLFLDLGFALLNPLNLDFALVTLNWLWWFCLVNPFRLRFHPSHLSWMSWFHPSQLFTLRACTSHLFNLRFHLWIFYFMYIFSLIYFLKTLQLEQNCVYLVSALFLILNNGQRGVAVDT